MYDVIIIGSGPAGYTAAIYAIRSGLKTLLLEGVNYGGQLMNTTDIENFPGFATGINGFDLMMQMRNQCKNLDCEMVSQDAIAVSFGDYHRVMTDRYTYETKTVIIATGATAKKLDLPNGDRLWNKGISACAVCDGALPMFRRKPLMVVGGGDTACEEALFLSRFGSIVYMLVRGENMRASHRMREQVISNDKIKILYHTQVVDVFGDECLEYVTVTDHGIVRSIDIAGLFYAIGHTPNTSFLPSSLEKDAAGYIVADNTKTNIPGVFACGDVQDKVYRQAITAAGSGCMAALEAERYI